MPQRRQLPPQIHRIELASQAMGKHVVRYQLTVDAGIVDAKRKQVRRSDATGRQAREELAKIHGVLVKGTLVRPRSAVGCHRGEPEAERSGQPTSDDHGGRSRLHEARDRCARRRTRSEADQSSCRPAAFATRSGTAPGKKCHAFGVRASRYVFATLRMVLEKPARKSSWPWLNISAAPLAAEGW
jgi:hypothetical protein